MLYINQIKDGALSIGEILEMLEEDYNIKFDSWRKKRKEEACAPPNP